MSSLLIVHFASEKNADGMIYTESNSQSSR